MRKILLLGKGISNNALHQFMLKYAILHDFYNLDEVKSYDYQLVVKGPGIYYQEAFIQKFIERQIPIITDVEFIYWFLGKTYIGITGSNGKTTTTMLISDFINTTYSAISCGNIGYPIAQAALDYKKYQYYVVELSSFELKGIINFAPKIAVITNLTQTHLDYHETYEDYCKSKYNITKNQTKSDYLIYNLDDEASVSLVKNSQAKKYTFSLTNQDADAFIKNGYFYFNKHRICRVKNLKQANIGLKYDSLAAIIVAKILGIKNYKIAFSLRNFKLAKYRMEEITKGIYNDAKSTNVFSTIMALKELSNKSVLLISGGYERKEELNYLDGYLSNVKRAYVYGMSKEKLAKYFRCHKIEVLVFANLKEATLKALNDRSSEVILYSPMFASYDQYKSYTERGKEFNRLVFDYYRR